MGGVEAPPSRSGAIAVQVIVARHASFPDEGLAMQRTWNCSIYVAMVLLVAAAVTHAQAPQAKPYMPHQPQPVDMAAHDLGRTLWLAQCVECHGGQARGTEQGPNLIRSEIVGLDRPTKAGAVLGPFLKKGHPTQSGKPSASFTDDEIFQLANFIRQRVNETMRGSPTYIVLPENILTGNRTAGEAFFKGEGGCTKCHTATSLDLAGIASRITDPRALQSRVFFPAPGGPPPARGGGAAPATVQPATGPKAPHPLAKKVTIARATGASISGTLVEQDAFTLTYSDDQGILRTVRKAPDVKVTITDPMQWHMDFANRITDKQMHDLTAYLWSLK